MSLESKTIDRTSELTQWVPIFGLFQAFDRLDEKKSVLQDLSQKYAYIEYQFTAALPFFLRMSDYFC